MDLSKVIGDAAVMASQAHITIPTGCRLKMAGTFCKALQALVFIDFYGQPQGGDLQPSQTAILIKKAIRQGELCLLYTSRCV